MTVSSALSYTYKIIIHSDYLISVCTVLLLFAISSFLIFNAYAQQGGAATGGSATSGAAINGPANCYGTCYFNGGAATGGAATGGAATSKNMNVYTQQQNMDQDWQNHQKSFIETIRTDFDSSLSFQLKHKFISSKQYQNAKNDVDSAAQKLLNQPYINDSEVSNFQNHVTTIQGDL